ncbi:MAG TPA: amidohydrolase family protein [Thermoanaerobaculia bacterium]|nr:amidohydrolase family protein [Thermoanaerobaculia bacterium]
MRTSGIAIALSFVAASLTAQPLVLAGGRLIDGYGGPPLENAVIVIEGNSIRAVGREGSTPIPDGARVLDTNGYTVMPGLMDMHVHLMILGHGDYDHWDRTYPRRFRDEIMPIAAKQLLMAGVTTVRDLGAPLEDIVAVKNRINAGEIPGPRLFVSGPFLQKGNTPLTAAFRWVVNGPEDARRKVRTIVAGGADVIKLIDQDQMTLDEVKAIVDEAHKAGKHVAAHAHRSEEIRQGLRAGVDCFEHTGLGTKPGYEEDVLQMMRERNATLYWCPTMEGLFLFEETKRNPERLDDQRLKKDLPPDIYRDVHRSIRDVARLDYFRLVSRRIPTLANKFRQLRESGVTIVVGTDSGIPLNFHFDSTWRELKAMADLGMPPMEVIRAATYWPAQLLRRPDLGVIAPGKLADIIVVDGDPLTEMSALRHVVHVIKDGRVYR